MEVKDIIGYWNEKFQYNHPRKVYKVKLCSEDVGWYCCSPHCQKHAYRWETKHMKKMLQAKDMKAYRLILPVGDIIPPPMLTRLWTNFTKKLRRLFPDCEWYWTLELQSNNLHYHVVVTTAGEMDVTVIEAKWLKALAKKGLKPDNGIKVDEIDDNYDTVAGYNVKHKWANSVKKRPAYGLYRNLAGGSRGFGRSV